MKKGEQRMMLKEKGWVSDGKILGMRVQFRGIGAFLGQLKLPCEAKFLFQAYVQHSLLCLVWHWPERNENIEPEELDDRLTLRLKDQGQRQGAESHFESHQELPRLEPKKGCMLIILIRYSKHAGTKMTIMKKEVFILRHP